MALSFTNQTVTVLRPSYVIERGTRTPVWDPPASESRVSGCRVQPMQGEEVLFSGSGGGGTARDARVTAWKLFGPPGMPIDARDRVRAPDGRVYEVDGPPQEWPSPTGMLRHTEARLKLVEG